MSLYFFLPIGSAAIRLKRLSPQKDACILREPLMAIADFHINLNIWLRWLHVLAGILWLGQLYVLDLVFLRLMRSLVDSQCDSTLRNIMLRGSEWLRWSSMTSALSGIFLFVSNYFYVPGVGFAPNLLLIEDRQLTERSLWILFGMALALVMWFNVWFVICPARRELLLRADLTRFEQSGRNVGTAWPSAPIRFFRALCCLRCWLPRTTARSISALGVS